ncbi:Coenzyme F420 hydrogenase/dehydrogenase, beta subunit C-terminal domain [Mucilaginibacter pedocola]|uniref:4Fe-4S ferredoxin-type domain-containing protein n=1 Tax=Mucilaginibacter pedocola TaxID=1792845 RepID=A0A1S9P8C7_9SPHI|nr:Coenzyme F420 hydrogenase/dehydrogenase, beta subunit C-terminal domain [Mucilaginibacter pedocola]OOQ57097.1 hypothetical protein BC343_16345 [Mucilaginibacter pedocola]
MGNKTIDKIYQDGLCLGCGFCEGICGKSTVAMELQSNGFLRPVVKAPVKKEDEATIKEICPGLNIKNDLLFDDNQRIWGKVEKLYQGFSTDSETRQKGSSGGMVSGIAIYMLQNKLVDAVLQVGGDANDYERNSLRISRTREDVLACASSRYAPALIFNKILDILNGSEDVFCFIGKPCDISGLKNFLAKYPQYKHRFKLTISIMCAGMPSFEGTKAIIDEFKAETPVKDLVYRGNGWPGYFSFIDKTQKKFQMTYNDSWGKRLGRHVHLRCKLCPDGIGLQADIAIGDAWETADGYPDFTEREGNSLIIARTTAATDILTQLESTGSAVYNDLKEQTIAVMQPFQFRRRQKVGVRTMAFTLVKRRRLNYQNLGLLVNTRKLPLRTIAGEFWGMFKRLIK